MIAQYRRLKEQHPDKILLFRLGDFYEMFNDDAKTAAAELEITLTSRAAQKGVRLPMAGIPHHAADAYIARLIERGHRVAVCDQVEDPAAAKGLVRREVTRIITPGTVSEPRLLSDRQNNYLVAVAAAGDAWGLAAADVSTGEFTCTEARGDGARGRIADEVARLSAAECLLPPELENDGEFRATLAARGDPLVTARPQADFEPHEARRRLLGHFGTLNLAAFGCEGRDAAVAAAGAVIAYLAETQRAGYSHVTRLTTYDLDGAVVVDATTRRNLEVFRRLADGGREGTLVAVLDLTVTALGARRLRSWLERPLLDVKAINERLDAVAALHADGGRRAALRESVKPVQDLERLASRCALGSAGARELSALRASLRRLPVIVEVATRLEADLAARLTAGADRPELAGLAAHLERALVDDPQPADDGSGVVRPGYDAELEALRESSRRGRGWVAALEAAERERTGIRSLRVSFNKIFGYYIEVSNANRHLVPPDYERRQTLTGGERYVTAALKEQEAGILGAQERAAALEADIVARLRAQAASLAAAIQAAARAVGELDALAALAEAAARYGYVRPEVHDGLEIAIIDGRHPVLEQSPGADRFVPNDCHLDEKERRVLIVTGPNMAGKSTYLRQVALIVLMAQAGGFVPASKARIGLVDRIFSRVGASDDIARGQSTFMVEMTGLAHILHHGTRRSLLILDEIGRGTSTYDGLSIAWAVTEYVHDEAALGARTLFATHYHELTRLEAELPAVKNVSVAVKERGDDVVFLRRIIPGGSDKSYGIHVARLAGLPPAVVHRAREVLSSLEPVGEIAAAGDGAGAPAQDRASRRRGQLRRYNQLALFEPSPDPVLQRLKDLDTANMTPLEALNALHALQEELRRGGGGRVE